jgi:hypothetical protein
LEKIKEAEVIEVGRLDETDRENQGFGSSRTGIQELRRTEEPSTLEVLEVLNLKLRMVRGNKFRLTPIQMIRE